MSFKRHITTMTHKHLFYGTLIGTALFVMGEVGAFAASLPNRAAVEVRLYKEAILEDGTLDKVTARLAKVAADKTKSKSERANALLMTSNLHWRHGGHDGAMKAIDRALDIEHSGVVMLQKARLLDAAGKPGVAKGWYEKALSLVGGDGKEKIRLRLAIMKADNPGVGSDSLGGLVDFAKNRDQGFQNRAAVMLALLGSEEQALELYKVVGKGGTPAFRQYVRLAEWSIRANKVVFAQDNAWRALKNAENRQDRLYGLAIVMESHRLDDSLDKVIDYFEQQEKLTPEAYQTWIDLLWEKGKAAQALALLQEREEEVSTSRRRQQMVRLYQEVGQQEKMVAEYRDLISKEPGEAKWPAALSEYYLEQGQREEARLLWQDFVRANADDGSSLFKGAGAMSRMDFGALTTTSLETYMKAHGTSVPMLFFLFEMNKEQGRAVEAEEILKRLEGALSADAPERADLAEAYERIGRGAQALVVWEGLAENGGGLDYNDKMRIARLYDGLGKTKEALKIWRSLWYEVDTPARRSFVENRMMVLAEEIGELDNMILELEESLFSNKTDKNASALLVRIYTRKRDKLSALEVIDEYFGTSGTIETLTEQAKVFRFLQDYAGFENINNKLLEIDPENKSQYLQSIILSLIEQGDGNNVDKILETLADLRHIDEDAVGGEFEAGVLVLAGLPDAGLEAYRESMARNMSNGDNYLLISDLLKKMGRTDEAMSLLQYVIEETQEDEVFVIAIDGILNMVGGAPDQGAAKYFRPVLTWVRRLVLERLADGTDRGYLYTILGEINDALGDREGNFAAVENTLSLSEIMRAATLRELVLKSKPKRFDKSYNDRHLAYGRRLVALNEELPPEVYIDLGRAFLEQKDPVGAQKSFNIAVDITGRKDIQAETATLFETFGYEDLAIDQYGKSLISNKNNLPVLMKISQLQELKGERDKANVFYGKALAIILRQLPVTVKNVTGAPSQDYWRYYKGLIHGYLASWPRDAQKAAANFDVIEHMLQGEIQRFTVNENDARKKRGPMAVNARLAHMAKFVRRVAFATGNTELADKMDARILGLFAADDDLAKSLIRERVDWGFYGSVRKLVRQMDKDKRPELWVEIQALLSREEDRKNLFSFDHALAMAKENKFFTRAKNIALLGGKPTEISHVAREMATSGAFMESLSWGKAQLDKKNYQNLCNHIAAIIRRNPERLIEGRIQASKFLYDLEEGLGQQVLSDHVLKKILADYGSRNNGRLASRILNYAIMRLAPEDMLEILDIVLSKGTPIEGLATGLTIWQEFQNKPVEAEFLRKMTDMIIEKIIRGKSNGNRLIQQVIGRLTQSDIHPANIEQANRINEAVKRNTALALNIFGPVYLLKTGEIEGAVENYVKLHWQLETSSVNANGLYPTWQIDNMFFAGHREALKKHFRMLRAQQGISEVLIALEIKLIYGRRVPDLDFLKEIVGKFPENETYLSLLFIAHQRQGEKKQALEVLEKLHVMFPKNMTYRAALFGVFIDMGRPAEALALNKGAPENMLEENFFSELWSAQRGAKEILSVVPVPDSSGAISLRTINQDNLKEALRGKQKDDIKKKLRTLWQNARSVQIFGSGRLGNGPSFGEVLQMPFAFRAPGNVTNPLFLMDNKAQQEQKIFDLVIEYDFAPEEFEDYLRGLNADDRDELEDMYVYLVRAYKKHGLVKQKWSPLNQAVLDDEATDEQYTLWRVFMDEGAVPISPDALKILDKHLTQHNNLSDYQLKSTARIFAKSGDMAHAVEAYRLLALRTLMVRHSTFSWIGKNTALSFVKEVGQYLEGREKTEFIREIIRLAAPRLKGNAAEQEVYARFVMKALAETSSANAVLVEIEEKMGPAGAGLSIEYLFDYAQLQLKAGHKEATLSTIRMAITKIQNIVPGRRSARSIYSRMLGIRSVSQLGIFVLPENMSDLFPALKTAENRKWLTQAAETMKAWEGNSVTRFMLSIAHQMRDAGMTDDVKALMADVSDRLASDPDPSADLISFALAVSEKSGQPLRLALMQRLLREGLLPPGYAGMVVERTVDAEGGKKALGLGEEALAQTRHQDLLTILISLAEQQGQNIKASLWRGMLQKERDAGKLLKALEIT